MPRYRWNGAEIVEITGEEPRAASGPYVQGDLPAYRTPLGTGWINGRTARREEMKRHNVREVDPSEFKRTTLVEPAHVREWRADRGISRDKPTNT